MPPREESSGVFYQPPPNSGNIDSKLLEKFGLSKENIITVEGQEYFSWTPSPELGLTGYGSYYINLTIVDWIEFNKEKLKSNASNLHSGDREREYFNFPLNFL